MMNDLYSDPLILPIHKPVDWTSYDVVRYVKKILKPRKVGHGGTLDPFAEGLLLILLNSATKRMQEIQKLPKAYEATLSLGIATDTQDSTGNIVAERPIPELTEQRIRQVLESLTGAIQQETPMYSARRYKGKRLYKLARKGKVVKRPLKKVHVFDLDLIDYDDRQIRFHTTVSSGTYIRTLGRDIALKLGTEGHLSGLIRTSIGDFNLNSAFQIEEIEQKCIHVMA